MGWDSGTGVAFTRDPSTGEKIKFGEYLANAQGEDVVAGIRTPKALKEMKDEFPEIHKELLETMDKLENHYKDMQDIEFTIEKGTYTYFKREMEKELHRQQLKLPLTGSRRGS